MQNCCIIIPCYNESERILAEEFLSFIETNTNFILLFVNDGSTDSTLAILQQLKEKHPNIDILDLPKNAGKAEAVRSGFLHIKNLSYSYVGYWDADLSTPLSEAPRFITFFTESTKIIMGTRLKRLGAVVKRSLKRHIFGRIFSTFTSIILDLPVYDSQCGAKIFRSELITPLFTDQFQTKWLMDVELLARYKRLVGTEQLLKSVIEVPVLEWKEVGGSKIKLAALLKTPFELYKIHRFYK